MSDKENRPRLFIGSSVATRRVAQAIQENWEHGDADSTIWTQGLFEPGHYTLDSLISHLDESDFGVFVFGPDDLMTMKDTKVTTTRDNVIFELGLFIGKLGKERNFIVKPRGVTDYHLPTDLLGLTPADYDNDKANLLSALQPPCNKILRVMERLGRFQPQTKDKAAESVSAVADENALDGNDCVALLHTWLLPKIHAVGKTYRFSDVDSELGLPSGSAKQYLATVGEKLNLPVESMGTQTIMFKCEPKQWIF